MTHSDKDTKHPVWWGCTGQRPDGKRVITRRLTAIDVTTRLNLALWDLTARYRLN